MGQHDMDTRVVAKRRVKEVNGVKRKALGKGGITPRPAKGKPTGKTGTGCLGGRMVEGEKVRLMY